MFRRYTSTAMAGCATIPFLWMSALLSIIVVPANQTWYLIAAIYPKEWPEKLLAFAPWNTTFIQHRNVSKPTKHKVYATVLPQYTLAFPTTYILTTTWPTHPTSPRPLDRT